MNEPIRGRRADKVERIVNALDIYEEDIFYGFDSDVLNRIYLFLDAELEFDNVIDLRHQLMDYFLSDEDRDDYDEENYGDDSCEELFEDIDDDEYDDNQIEKFNYVDENHLPVESNNVLDLVPKIITNINRSRKTVQLTSRCYLSTDLYRLEREINEEKRKHKINLYLDHRIFSNSIINSMLNDYDDSWFHYEFTYNMPLMVFLFDQRERGDIYKTIIKMSRKFFSQEHIAEHLVKYSPKIGQVNKVINH